MVEYTKPWLSLEQQVEQLKRRGVYVEDRDRAVALLTTVGYYRLTGYLYPFRRSERHDDGRGRPGTRVLSDYRPGTTLDHAAEIIDFDRQLRMLVMEGLERLEIAARMRIGYVLGRSSPFAHDDPATFTETFTTGRVDDGTGAPMPSPHASWLERVEERRAKSDEPFVAHFRDKYNDQVPIWVLTEILELGQLSVLYRGLRQQEAVEIATAFGAPTKKIMVSWLSSLNYVRNVAAHHARLFNRKLQNAPARPKVGAVPSLDHLRDHETAKGVYGTYSALAVMAHLLVSVEAESGWARRVVALLKAFPASCVLSLGSMGVPQDWESFDLWCSPPPA